jgi:predicted tellurium resistance membrane protein TerC
MAELLTTDNLIAFVTLTFMEIVLGIDNIIFISILAGKLPADQQVSARQLGLLLALGMRILLLLTISFIVTLTLPLFTVLGQEISGRDIVLIVGGIFLIAKATREIHERLEGEQGHAEAKIVPSFRAVIIQILVLDVVFSLDSVITAVGMVNEIAIMIGAVIVAIVIMLLLAGRISDFVNKHPTVKMLALSFLLLIGFMLLLEGFDQHVPKGYIYFAIGFSVFVEMLNLRSKNKNAPPPVELHQPYTAEGITKS